MSEEQAAPRKPGRPRQTEETMPKRASSLKKGNSSWTPASLNEFTGKEDGYRYRMSRKDSQNLSKKAQEGWETVSSIQSGNILQQSTNRIDDGAQLTSVHEGYDWVLQRLPEEIAKERDAYYNNESHRRVASLTSHFKNEMKKHGGNAPTHGEITISSRTGTQIID